MRKPDRNPKHRKSPRLKPEADAESTEKDVLLQSTEEESEEESEEVVEEEEEEEAEEAEAEPPKAVGKLLKQVNKLTARAKSAEENAEALRAEIEALKANPQSATEPQKPALEEVNTFEELESLRKEALAAKRWSLQHIGKDYVEVDGKEYSDDDIRGILTQAEDYLTEKIPQRLNIFSLKPNGPRTLWQLTRGSRKAKALRIGKKFSTKSKVNIRTSLDLSRTAIL